MVGPGGAAKDTPVCWVYLKLCGEGIFLFERVNLQDRLGKREREKRKQRKRVRKRMREREESRERECERERRKQRKRGEGERVR